MQLVFDSLKKLNTHANVEQVYDDVVIHHPTITKATVYRNLKRMESLGMVLDIGNFDGAVRYDHNCHDHAHLFCDECGRVFDVDGNFGDLCSHAIAPDGVEIRNFQLTFSGLCRDCRE